jgi:hypothetical protein
MRLEYQAGVFPHPVKPDRSPAFLRNAQFCPKRSQEGGSIDSVVGDPVRVRINETFQFPGILSGDPSRQLIFGGDKARVHAIFVLEPVSHDLELQSAYGAKQQGAPGMGAENLDRTLFA